jgi:hypothetical protein
VHFSYRGQDSLVVTGDANRLPDLDVLMAAMDRDSQMLIGSQLGEAQCPQAAALRPEDNVNSNARMMERERAAKG